MLRSPLQPILRNPLSSPLKYGVRSIAAAIRSLFANNEQGWWYDPSDLSTLYQDAAGTTPVTAMEQTVGLMLDKSKGLQLGPDKWVSGLAVTAGESSVVSDGVYKIFSSTGVYSAVTVSGSMTIGKTYRAEFNIDSISVEGGGITIEGSAPPPISQSVGKKVCIFTATGVNFGIKRGAGPVDMQVSNISVRELPGNHEFQTTLTKRMKVSRRVNLLVGTAALATQNTPTVAGAHTLKFTGAGSVTLSGTATGTYTAGTHAITCTAGTLTLTVAGAVNDADFRLSIDNHFPFQRVNTSTDYDDDPAKFPTLDVLDGIDDSAVTSAGGGGTTGFFFSAAIKVNGGAGANRTLFSDAGTNTGYIVRLNTSNQLELAAGNGTAYTTIATTGTLEVGAVDVVQAWDDGTNLNVRIGNGAVASVARPTVSAGTAACSIGQDNGASSGYFNGGFYSKIYRRNSAPTQSQRDSVLTYQRQKAMAA